MAGETAAVKPTATKTKRATRTNNGAILRDVTTYCQIKAEVLESMDGAAGAKERAEAYRDVLSRMKQQ